MFPYHFDTIGDGNPGRVILQNGVYIQVGVYTPPMDNFLPGGISISEVLFWVPLTKNSFILTCSKRIDNFRLRPS